MRAEYKQVTVLFADVVRSMDIAAALGANVDGAVRMSRALVDDSFGSGEMRLRGPATVALVEALLQRGTEDDVREARTVIDRLAAVPTDPGFMLFELPLLRLRALLARSNGDDPGYLDFRDRYRTMANTLDYQGHMALSDAMD